MTTQIPTIYTDKSGSVNTTITNDGKHLTLIVDNTKFISNCFDDFAIENIDSKPPRFSLNHFHELTDCRLLCQIPITLLNNGKDIETVLTMDLELNCPTQTHYATKATFSLTIEGKEITTNKVELFEGGLGSIKAKLPNYYMLKCCFGCAYSDYSVAGQDLFGNMLCFRNNKDEYLKVKDKEEYMDIMESFDRFVQETFLCPDFQTRTKGTGYRG